MFVVTVFDKQTEVLVAEYDAEGVEWSSIKSILKVSDEFPMGEYPLDEEEVGRLAPFLRGFDQIREGCIYYIGEELR